MVKTANVSRSMTITAMLQSHQSRCSSFCSFACNSGRLVSGEGSGLSAIDVDGDEFMTGRESWAKSEIRYTIINPAENGNGRKCARRTARANVPRDSLALSYCNA